MNPFKQFAKGSGIAGRRAKRIFSLFWALQAPNFCFGSHDNICRELTERCRHIVETHGIRIDVSGALPQSAGILVANHLGYLDPILICNLVNCSPVAKFELSKWPLIGHAARKLGILFVERDSSESGASVLRKMRQLLARQESVLVFPEGTTTDGRIVLPFNRGVFGLSRMLDAPVYPITISYEDHSGCWIDDEEFITHYVAQASKANFRVKIHFHEACFARQNESAKAFAQRVRLNILSHTTSSNLEPIQLAKRINELTEKIEIALVA